MVIPAMDTIDEVLATSTLSSKYSLAIHAALSVGKKTLNHYYLKTDLSNTYRIAMGTCSCFFISVFYSYCSLLSVLHPHHKLNYFKKAKWEDGWIKAAKQLVRAEFDLSYRRLPNSQDNEVRIAICKFFFVLLILFVRTIGCGARIKK